MKETKVFYRYIRLGDKIKTRFLYTVFFDPPTNDSSLVISNVAKNKLKLEDIEVFNN